MINITSLQKFASELQEQQKRVLNKLDHTNSILAFHATGSGKTYTALSAGQKFHKPITVVGPASLRNNFDKEKLKHNIKVPVSTYSYNKPPTSAKGSILVYDEAHRMGSLNSKRSHLPETLRGDKTIFLTASPIKNRPSEIISIARGLGINFPRDEKAFNDKFIHTIKVQPNIFARVFKGIKPGEVKEAKNLDQFKKSFHGKVDYYHNSKENYPSEIESDIKVDMSKGQEATYKMALKGHPSLAYKVQHGIAPSKAESNQMNAFLTATRQISNFPGDYNLRSSLKDAPKITRAYEEINKRVKSDVNYRGASYSAYINSGIKPLSDVLTKNHISNAMFTGKTSDKDRKQIIHDYNHGKIKQLLLSGAGSEGLDLKGTKLLQIMEPHWNEATLQQVRGRASRYMSHAKLPANERHVEVQNFIAQPRKHGFIFKSRKKGTDEYLQQMAANKQHINDQFLNALKEVGSAK